MKSNILILLFCTLFSFASYAKKLPRLMTKQDLSNLRFISEDGRFTYYQMKSGKLYLSLNYEIAEVLSYPEGTQYEVLGSHTKEFLIVSVAPQFHQHLSPRKNKKLFILKYGSSSSEFLGEGSFPRFQLNSTWSSYYDSIAGTIYYKNLISPAVSFFIELNNTLAKYFVPETVMVTKDIILYTDVNKDGHQGLLLFDRSTRKPKLIHKLTSNSQRLELCEFQGNIYAAQFNLITDKKSSKIFKLSKQGKKKGKNKGNNFHLETIYSSQKEDIGNLVCNIDEESIYFIKDYSEGTDMAYDIARLDLNTKRTTRMTEMKKVFQFFQMDKKILVPYQGEYYVLKGESNNKTIDNLETKLKK